MNKLKIAKQVQQFLEVHSSEILEMFYLQATNNIDPFTGEKWQGNSRFLLRMFDLMAENYKAVNTNLPDDIDFEESTDLQKAESIVNMMLQNVIDPKTAENMMKVVLQNTTIKQIQNELSKTERENSETGIKLLEMINSIK